MEVPEGMPQTQEEFAARQQQAAQEQEARKALLISCVDDKGRSRLGRIGLVNPDKQKIIEDRIIQMAKSGALKSEVSEAQIMDFLEQIDKSTNKTSVKIMHKKGVFADEEEEGLFDDF